MNVFVCGKRAAWYDNMGVLVMQIESVMHESFLSHIILHYSFFAGDHLTICSQESTCCTQEMEHKLSTLARADYERLFGDHVNRFKALLIARTTRFDGTYLALS